MLDTQAPKRSIATTRGRVMLCNLGRLGDTILRNSILESAFRTYSTVDYMCGPGNAELVRNDSRLNKVTVFDKSLASWVALLKNTLRNRYDAYIELKDHSSSTSLTLAYLFRSRLKTGYNSGFARPFHRNVQPLCATNQHQTETMRRIGRLAGLETGEYKPSLVLPADSINWFQRNHGREMPYIFLNISATCSDRMWPAERWARYVSGCGLENEMILVNGVSKDSESVAELCARLPRAVPFQPRQFMDVAAAINNARLVLTVDTGVVHACSALNTPIVALYCAGNMATINKPLSSKQLVIEARGDVTHLDPEDAIAQTLRHGLPFNEVVC